jgi:hypothetical protein
VVTGRRKTLAELSEQQLAESLHVSSVADYALFVTVINDNEKDKSGFGDWAFLLERYVKF